MRLALSETKPQFDDLIDDKQEHFSQPMKIRWCKKLNFFAFLIFKPNKTSILFTFLSEFVFNFLHRKSCLNYKMGSRQIKIYLRVRIKKV